MENKVVLLETADMVNSNLTLTKDEQIDQNPEKELPVVEEEVVKAEESPEKDENGERKVAEQVELKQPNLVKESVEAVDADKAEEKSMVESVAEKDNKYKEEKEMVDVSDSTDESIGKEVEPVDVSAETVEDKNKDVEVLEVDPETEASEKVETESEKANELAPEVVKLEETPETTEQSKAELETNSGINLKDEMTSESVSSLYPEEVVPINQDSDIAHKEETQGEASSPADVTEKATTEENHAVDEPSKDEKASESVSTLCLEKVVPAKQDSDTNPEKETKEDVSSPADVSEKAITEEKHVLEEPNVSEDKDTTTKLATEDDNIKKDTEPVTEDKSKETLKEADTESREKENKQEESITEKVTEVIETSPVVKENYEPKQQQQQEVTAKDVTVRQKHPNSIISKVKQSFVKAKKAIIGKSPSSKTISTEEVKEEIKV